MDSIEQWKPVVGYEGFYEVSDRGRVRSLTRTITTSHGQNRTYKGSIKEPTVRDGGRRVVSLQVNGQARARIVSHLVAEAFLGKRPQGMLVCHNNGNPGDNRLSNLRYDTYSENMHDKKLHGTDHNVNKTHCPRGHSLSGNNLIASKLKVGSRECRACNLSRSYIKKHPELKDDFKALADSYFKKLQA